MATLDRSHAVGQASRLSLTSSGNSLPWGRLLAANTQPRVRHGNKHGDRRDACPTLPVATRAGLILALAVSLLVASSQAAAFRVPTRNPILRGADPHVLVVDNTAWLYPTWGRGGTQFFAFSSTNLTDWQQHGPVLSLAGAAWIKDDGAPVHRAWAPGVAQKAERFFFYYSVGPQDPTPSRIGVAVGDRPEGPFKDSGRPLLTGGNGFEAIDPMVFTDSQSGKSFLYAGGSAGAKLRVFELNDDMVSFAREVPVETPPQFTEGAFMHEREGTYYLSYSHGNFRDASYSVHYATATAPTGPWHYRGAILTSDRTRKGPGHHSFFRDPLSGEWFVAYHRWDNVTGDGPFRGSRQVAIDRLEHGADGLIKPVVMTDGVPPPSKQVPGVVMDHSPASSGLYIGSPSLAVLTNGHYLATHDFFGPKSAEHESATTAVFRSTDRGATWMPVAHIRGAFWSSLFVHRGAAYLMGTDKHHGRIVLRRSTDDGATWTEPRDPASGLLAPEGQYHTAPMPVIEHNGRLWRAFEDAMGGTEWGKRYRAGMLSAPADADLLIATNWAFSNFLPRDPAWFDGKFNAWLEGNAVVAPDGQLVNILRVDTPDVPEQAAVVNVSADGRTVRFDPATGFVELPGGAKKFTIRADPRGGGYWTLATIVPASFAGSGRPGGIRNTLALLRSPDLRKWEIHCVLLHHPDVAKHGFQYPDWHFDGEDLIAVVRTAYDDGEGGARNNHDANYLTFHRWPNFRSLTPADSVRVVGPPQTRVETASFVLTGSGFEPARLADGEKAFSNRTYVWDNVPERIRGWRYTRTAGGERAVTRVLARQPVTLHLATATTQAPFDLAGWREVPGAAFGYNDLNRTRLQIYQRSLAAGETLVLPQRNWTGTLLLWPE
jgi:hypothetical protein